VQGFTAADRIRRRRMDGGMARQGVRPEQRVAVMEQHDFGNIPTDNPHMYTGMDGDTTFLVYTSSSIDPHADWKGHMVSAWCAEVGDPCYEIRKAIEKLVIEHNAGPVPVKESWAS
jgi:hypothetical protein